MFIEIILEMPTSANMQGKQINNACLKQLLNMCKGFETIHLFNRYFSMRELRVKVMDSSLRGKKKKNQHIFSVIS